MTQFILKNGTGDGYTAQVDARNRLKTRAITQSETQFANLLGDAYNINTGTVSISGDTGILYFKNLDAEDFVLDSFAVGVGAGSFSDSVVVTVIRNPTAGTLIDTATAVDMNQNRNFGSSKTLSGNAYKGASGATVTGGDNIAQFFQTGQGRLFATVDFELPKSSAVGLKVEPNLSSGSVNMYAALIGHLKDSKD
jgi:hypothetical protein